MSVQYTPLADRVIVEPQAAEQVTKSGILLPDTAQEKPQLGKVVAVGPGKTTEAGQIVPMSVNLGDVVVYAKYGGTEIKVEGNELLIIRENDILAIKKG